MTNTMRNRLYSGLKEAYRRVAPESMSSHLFGGRSLPSRLILRVKAWLERSAEHDDLYDRVYYNRQEGEMSISGPAIAASLAEKLGPRTVVDVGCGSGSVLAALRELNIDGIGLDYADAALELCREKGLNVRKFDLESEYHFGETAEVVLSTEVAEHLPESVADRYVDLLCSISPYVVMTAAPPGQGGTDHVNEQPNEYWIRKFSSKGRAHSLERDLEWRTDWRRRSVDRHRANNVMVFGPFVNEVGKSVDAD